MNKNSIYQNIIKNYNISPNFYTNIRMDIIDTDTLWNEETIMNIIFSKYITDTVYTETNKTYINFLLKNNYIFSYENDDFIEKIEFYEDNMVYKNKNDKDDSSPTINKMIIDFDVISYASIDAFTYLLYLDIIAGIYDKVYYIKDNEGSHKIISELIIPCRYKFNVDTNTFETYPMGFHEIKLRISRTDDIKNQINDISIISEVDLISPNGRFITQYKADIINHLNFLSGEDVSYSDKKYLKDISYFYKFCKLKMCYAIFQAIYLLSKKPGSAIDISTKISEFMKRIILAVFINFKDMINIQAGGNKYETNKNVLYNTNVINNTNKIDIYNKRIIKNRDILSKKKKINNVIKDKSKDIKIIKNISISILLFVVITCLITVIIPLNTYAKGGLCLILALIVVIIYIIFNVYMSSKSNIEETFLDITNLTSKRYPPIKGTNLQVSSDKKTQTFTVSGQNYGNGEYIISQSSIWNNWNDYMGVNSFDFSENHYTRGNYSYSSGVPAVGTYSTNGSYAGNINTVYNGNVNYKGEWIQIKLPKNILLISYTIICYSTNWGHLKSFVVLGSNDGNTWKLLDNQTLSTLTSNKWNFNISNIDFSNLFSYYRICVNTINSGGATWYLLDELLLYGEEGDVVLDKLALEKKQKEDSERTKALLSDLEIKLNAEKDAKKREDDANKNYQEAVNRLRIINENFEKAKSDLEKNRDNVKSQIEVRELAKQKESADLDVQIRNAENLAAQKASELATKEADNIRNNQLLTNSRDLNTRKTNSINDLKDVSNNAMNAFLDYVRASEDSEIAMANFIKADGSLKTITASVRAKIESTAQNIKDDLEIQTAQKLRDIAKIDADQKIADEQLAKIKLDLEQKKLKKAQDDTMAKNLQDANKNMTDNIAQLRVDKKLADDTYNQAILDKQTAQSKQSILLAEANREFNLNKSSLEEVNAELASRIANETTIKEEKNKEENEQRNIELQQIAIEAAADSIISFNNEIINQKNQDIEQYNQLLEDSRKRLEDISKTKRDLENELTRLQAKSQTDISNAENRYLQFDLDTKRQIKDLEEQKTQKLADYAALQIERNNRDIEAIAAKSRRDDLEGQLAQKIKERDELVASVNYQKDITNEYEISYILKDVDILLLNNLNDNINGINYDLVVPLLNIEENAYDKYSSDLTAYANKAKHDINVQKLIIQEDMNTINLYMLSSLLVSTSFGINYYSNPVIAIISGTIFSIYIITTYSIRSKRTVRTSAKNKYWEQPKSKLEE